MILSFLGKVGFAKIPLLIIWCKEYNHKMTRQIIKQIFYGTGFFLIFFLIISGSYFIWLKPSPSCFDGRQNQGEIGIDCGGPCIDCEIKILNPLEVSWLRHFPVDDRVVIAAEIRNPNFNYGADNFSYIFTIYNYFGEKIYTLNKNSFIYAGEIKYLIEANIDINPKNINKIKLSFSNINWKSKEEFPRPEIQIREIRTESAQPIRVSGLVINNNAFALSDVNVVSFLFNKNGFRIGASIAKLGSLPAFEEKFFRIVFPGHISLIAEEIIEKLAPINYKFTRNLTIGSRGEDVKSLQQFLKEQGFFNREITNYFGLITKNSLIQYQKKAGISPASGYFGPITRNHINSLITPVPLYLPKFNINEADPGLTRVYVDVIR